MTTTPVTINKQPPYIPSAPLSLINETSIKKIQLTIKALDHTNLTTTTTTTTIFAGASARDVDGNWG